MSNGKNTDVKGGFRTRYHITPIDSLTGLPDGPTTTVDNMVLMSGYLALGDPTAYTSLSIGTNPLPPNPHQTGILIPIAQEQLTNATFNQHIEPDGSDVISVCAYEFLFKEFTFPANLKTLDLCEIGLDGVTRAVFPVVQITRNNWVKVIMEVMYVYVGENPPTELYYDAFNGDDFHKLVITTEAFVFNNRPNNVNGRGWGADRSILCYPWSGTEGDYIDRNLATSLGMTITPRLVREQYHWEFNIAVARAAAPTNLHGLIVRDSVNGGGFLLRFHGENPSTAPFELMEDGSIDLTVNYSWYQTPVGIVVK